MLLSDVVEAVLLLPPALDARWLESSVLRRCAGSLLCIAEDRSTSSVGSISVRTSVPRSAGSRGGPYLSLLLVRVRRRGGSE